MGKFGTESVKNLMKSIKIIQKIKSDKSLINNKSTVLSDRNNKKLFIKELCIYFKEEIFSMISEVTTS